MSVDEDLLQRWHELSSKATPAPWRTCGAQPNAGCACGLVWSIPADMPVAAWHNEDGHSGRAADVLFIAAARTAVPTLLAEVVRLRKIVDPDAEHARLVLLKDATDAAIAEVVPKMDAHYGETIEKLAGEKAALRAELANLLAGLSRGRTTDDDEEPLPTEVTTSRTDLQAKLLAFLVGEFARKDGCQCVSVDLLYHTPGFHDDHLRSWTREDEPEVFEDPAWAEQLVSAILDVAEDEAAYKEGPQHRYVVCTRQHLGGRAKCLFKLLPPADGTDSTDSTDISAQLAVTELAALRAEIERMRPVYDMAVVYRPTLKDDDEVDAIARMLFRAQDDAMCLGREPGHDFDVMKVGQWMGRPVIEGWRAAARVAIILGAEAPEAPTSSTSTSRHCDDYVGDSKADPALRWFIFVTRGTAAVQILARERGTWPTLFADHEGNRVRVVMASRLGDVGITSDLTAEDGYGTRVFVDALSNFSEKA